MLLSHGTVDAFDAAFSKAALVDPHDAVELLLADIALVFDALLEIADHLEVFSLLLMLILHLEVLQRLVELLVLRTKLLFLERLDLNLLLQQLALDLEHMVIVFKHFCVEIIRPTNRHTCLHQEREPFDNIVSRDVIAKSPLSANNVLTRQSLF